MWRLAGWQRAYLNTPNRSPPTIPLRPVPPTTVTPSATARALPAAVAGLLVLLAGCGGPVAPSVDAPAPAGADAGSPTATTSAATDATHAQTTGTDSPTRGTDAPMTDSDPTDRTPSPEKHPSLASALVGLVDAGDRAAYAERHGLELRNGSVGAVVELVDGRDLPAGFDVAVEVRAGGDVQALVAVEDLVALAEHGNVSFVRPPDRPVPDDGRSA